MVLPGMSLAKACLTSKICKHFVSDNGKHLKPHFAVSQAAAIFDEFSVCL